METNLGYAKEQVKMAIVADPKVLGSTAVCGFECGYYFGRLFVLLVFCSNDRRVCAIYVVVQQQ